jgi:DNA-directed RNA polymerase specialized sigma24 family protein
MQRSQELPEASAVLTRATLRASDRLGVSQRELASVLGVSAASLSRLGRTRSIDPDSKEGELALLFVRIFRSLDSLTGGDDAAARAWLHAANTHLGGTPAELIVTVPGLVHVVEYLDAMRGTL